MHPGNGRVHYMRDIYGENTDAEPPEDGPGSIGNVLASWSAHGPLIHEPTGFASIDEATGGGPCYGSRWYISGAPDSCKTALIVQIAHTYAERGIAVGILAVDEEASDIVTRLAQRVGFSRNQCETRAPEDVAAIADLLDDLPIRLYDATWTIERAAKDVASFAKSKGTRACLCIDSTQTVRCDAELRAEREMSTPAAIEARVHAIRAVATEHQLIALATSEMSRAAYRSKNTRENVDPMAGSKWSGAIEYSARVLVAMRSVPEQASLIEVEIAKNKHGARREPIYLAMNRAEQTLHETSYTPPLEGDAREARATLDDSKVSKMEEAILLALVQANAKGRRITGQRELRALVKGRDQIKAAAVASLIASGRIEGGRGEPFVPRYEEVADD